MAWRFRRRHRRRSRAGSRCAAGSGALGFAAKPTDPKTCELRRFPWGGRMRHVGPRRHRFRAMLAAPRENRPNYPKSGANRRQDPPHLSHVPAGREWEPAIGRIFVARAHATRWSSRRPPDASLVRPACRIGRFGPKSGRIAPPWCGKCRLCTWGVNRGQIPARYGAEAGVRTLTPLRAADFKSAASASSATSARAPA